MYPPGLPPLRWGVLGVSELVGRLAVLPALQRSHTATLIAIGSRDFARAQAEAARFGAARAYGSYAGVLDDPEVEAVYLPLPNSMHLEWTLRAAAAGKHVLCEKPLACTAAEGQEMADACRAAGVLLAEAYMTPFHPRSARALEIARSGVLGDLRFAQAAFTFTASAPPPPLQVVRSPQAERGVWNYRWFPEMGGGALLDVGIYCLAPLVAAAGRPPARVTAGSVMAPSGVDASFSGWLDFDTGFTAAFATSFEAPEQQLLVIAGTRGRLTIDTQAFTAGPKDTTIRLARGDGSVEAIECAANDPYLAMIEHFAAAARSAEPLRRTPGEAITLLALLDRLRQEAMVQGPGT